MSQLNKTQLEQENQQSFPNNNTGFITPLKLREFNTDMIDSLVDEGTYNTDSASIVTHLDNLQAEVDALVLSGSGVVIQEEGVTQGTATLLNFVGASVTASVSGGFATINVNATATDLSGLNQFSQSINAYTGSINQFTQSINQYTASNNQFSASVANEINVLEAEVDSLQAVTGSYATTSSLNNLSSSLASRLTTDEGNISSNTGRIQNLEAARSAASDMSSKRR